MRIYLSHPFGGDPENLYRARQWLTWLAGQHPADVIVASWLLWADLDLYDGREEAALDACCEEVATCGAIVLAGIESLASLTPGMRREHERALGLGLRLEHYFSVVPPTLAT
jgi:hypothetical protein